MSLLEELLNRPAWQARAACRGMAAAGGSNIFFPERGESTAEAKATCARCPVKEECYAFAVTTGDVGVWGGASNRQRVEHRQTGRTVARFGIPITTTCARCHVEFTYVPRSSQPRYYCAEACRHDATRARRRAMRAAEKEAA